jgi:hypothetical protein
VENVTKAYICDACGRISTITWDDGSCHYCLKSTHVLTDEAVEIPIPKSELGTDFIAVVYRGKVVDVLLASGRSSVYGYFWGELERMQEYVDHLEPANETLKPTDIEVKHGNNVYVVRLEDDVPRILIPAISTEVELGDSHLSGSEREQILTLALRGMPSLSEAQGTVVPVLGPAPRRPPETTPYRNQYNCPYGDKTCGEQASYCWRCNKKYEEFLLLINDDR